jgi:bifunctional non-homologous end joining protein LigD
MTLSKYNEKRDFSKTAEPKAGISKDKNKLIFVIQKHDASHLHYDFRLEMDGVLKSWAVPKGPSLDPKTKRLAMMVEDHPFDYRNFEGIIPKGEYGGGTVIVWDQGTYEPIEPIKGKKAQEKHLLEDLAKGQVKMKLHGEKLNGEFALVKTHGMGENSWLLIKHNDDFAAKADITKKDKSVLSDKTIKQMAESSDKVWKDGHAEKNTADKKTAKKGTKAVSGVIDKAEEKMAAAEDTPEPLKINLTTLLKTAPKTKILTDIKPMKATLVDDPFDSDDWLYEVKWDGYRAIASVNKNEVELTSRNKIPFDKYYPIVDLMKGWDINAVLDGEILVLNEKGVSDFGALQNWRSEADGELVFYVFDILWYEGKSLIDLPLIQRQAILSEVLPVDDDRVRLSKVFHAKGIEFFKAATKIGLEGIMAKKADSTYTSDLRSREWLKIKVQRRQEVVIAGFTKNKDTEKPFSALILGVYQDKKLIFSGKVGTGFSVALQKEMMAQFEPLITDKVPFDKEPDIDKPSRFRPQRLGAKPTWLKPQLVCEVAYAEVTTDGVFRQASFKGMRIDKNAKDVVLEKPVDTNETVEEVEGKAAGAKTKGSTKLAKGDSAKDAVEDKHTAAIKPPANKDRKTLLNPKDETQVRKVCGHDLKFTHLSKIYWPDDKVTKRDMFNYYYQVAPFILPYLKDRPMSLNRFPGGITSKGFYQKDVTGKAPDWAKTFAHTTDEGKDNHYLVGNDEATLLWMASLGCIEMNPWFSRVQSPDNPDYCVIDLDPDKNTFDQVIETALVVKKTLDAIDVSAVCKTSGSTGIHIYIPLDGQYSYDQSQLFAKIIVGIVHKELESFTSLERSIAARKGKMYLDFLQNRPGATIACPYSLRPKPGATVSMPLAWDELKPGLKMRDFTIFNAIDRLKETGDLFELALGKGIDLAAAVKKAKDVFGS